MALVPKKPSKYTSETYDDPLPYRTISSKTSRVPESPLVPCQYQILLRRTRSPLLKVWDQPGTVFSTSAP